MGALTGVAPVCYVNPQPQQFATNPVFLSSIPPAVPTSLGHLAAILNMFRQNAIVQGDGIIGGSTSTSGTAAGSSGGGDKGGKGQPTKQPNPQKQPASNFVLESQNIKKVKVYDPNDTSGETFVTVNQITALTMVSKTTGQKWIWTAPAGLNPSVNPAG